MPQLRLALLAATAWTLSGPAALAQTHDHGMHGMARLGTVEFEVACSAAAQAQFNTAMALFHSFAWPATMAAFEEVAATDPACGMAHWGRAMALLGNPFTWPAALSPKLLDEVAAALDEAAAAGLADAREAGYVAAVGAFVADHASRPYAERLQAYDDAMRELRARHPEDLEAQVLSALVTSANFDPHDKAYSNQLAAAAILEPLFAAHPDHPGVAHYLIHSYDYPPIAHQGLDAALAYAEIAPDAAHALHMPSHIFTRVGMWEDSIAANRESARVAGDATFDAHHAADYKVYAHLQLGQDRAAEDAMQASLAMRPVDNFAAAYAYAAMPARLALETDDWRAAATLELAPAAEAYPWAKYPQAEAINAFARGIGAARSGEAQAARAEAARLEGLREVARERRLGYWAEQIDIQAALVAALARCAEGAAPACIDGLRATADREDATEKHVVTPGPLVPARELLADTLLELGRPAEALAEYEAVMEKEPNRYRTIAGAMAAADAAGAKGRATALALDLLELGAKADSERAGLALASEIAGG